MKLKIHALGIVLASTAAPAFAQYGYSAPQQPAQATAAAQQGQQPAEQQQNEPKIKPSPKALEAIVALQNAVRNKDWASVPEKLTAAQAVAKTKEDKYLIGIFQREAALGQHDNAALAAAVNAITTSGFALDAEKTSALFLDLGVQQFNAGQLPQAGASFERAAQINPSDAQPLEFLAQTKFKLGQKAEAAAAYQRAIKARLAAGQKPQGSLYNNAVVAAYEGNSPLAVDLAREWVAAYPSAESWRNAIAIYRNMTKPDVEGTLDLLRLMQATGALSQPADYNLFATAAADQSNFNEAKAVIDQGLAAKQIDASSPLFRDTIAGLKTKPIATEADLATAAKTATSGMALLRIGDRYYALGQYAKAVDLYRQSMGKPGVDANIANLHIGMALARAGDKAGATTALNAVTGDRAEIAKVWLLYLQGRG
jgi:tetratricopeptide (TPR) repeat protein